MHKQTRIIKKIFIINRLQIILSCDNFIFDCLSDHYRDGLDDPLDDSGMVTQQLDQMSVIARCEYGKTCQLLVQLFNNAAQNYQEMISNMGTSKIDISIQEGQ